MSNLEDVIEYERKKEKISPSIKHDKNLKEVQRLLIDGHEYDLPLIAIKMIEQRDRLLALQYENTKMYDIALRSTIPILETYSCMIGGKAVAARELLDELEEEFPHMFPKDEKK